MDKNVVLCNQHEDWMWLTAGRNYHAGLYASFLKGQGHQGIFFLVKGTLWWNCKFVLEHFKGTKAMTRGHGGNRLRCLREVSGLIMCRQGKKELPGNLYLLGPGFPLILNLGPTVHHLRYLTIQAITTIIYTSTGLDTMWTVSLFIGRSTTDCALLFLVQVPLIYAWLHCFQVVLI